MRVPCPSLRRPQFTAIGTLVAALVMLGAGCRDDGNDLIGADATNTNTFEGADSVGDATTTDDASGTPTDTTSTDSTLAADTTDPVETQASTGAATSDTASSPTVGSDAPDTSDSPSTTESAPPPTSTLPTTTTTTGPPIDAGTQSFCDAIVTAETTFVRGPDIDVATATAEEIAAATEAHEAALEALLDEAVATAPAAVAPDVVTVVDFVRSSLATGEDLTSNPDFRPVDERVDVFVAGSCGYDTIEVSGVDYAFENLPASLPAGRTSFAFTNDGEEIHEMVVFRINDGVTETIDQLLALPEEEAFSKVQFTGAAFGVQDETDTETFELTPGRYVALCFVPIGSIDPTIVDDGTEPLGPPHFTEGMQAEFTVT